jgi:hypothetical protein
MAAITDTLGSPLPPLAIRPSSNQSDLIPYTPHTQKSNSGEFHNLAERFGTSEVTGHFYYFSTYVHM